MSRLEFSTVSALLFSVLSGVAITSSQLPDEPIAAIPDAAARIEPIVDPLFSEVDDVAPPSPGLVVDAEIVSVYDGDTITVQPLFPEMKIRLLDCWAPEIRTRDLAEKVRGYESRDNLREMLPDGARVRIHIPATGRLQDSLTLGRVLGYVWIDVDNDGEPDNVSREQVAGGFATRTKGGGG